MEEKKLTDEEVVKALKCCSKSWDCNNCKRDKENNNRFICSENLLKDCLDLIHRLQAENEQLKDEKEEIRLFNLSIQNGEVDMRIESEMAKSFYNSIIQIFEQNGAKNFFTTTVDIEGKKGRYVFTIEKVGGQTVAEKLADQKAEIERLTEENDLKRAQVGLLTEQVEYLKNCGDNFLADCEKLQKQVDELKGELEKAYEIERANIQAEIAEAGTSCHWCKEQAVKDTAKEICEMIDGTCISSKGYLCSIISKRYGVEVE